MLKTVEGRLRSSFERRETPKSFPRSVGPSAKEHREQIAGHSLASKALSQVMRRVVGQPTNPLNNHASDNTLRGESPTRQQIGRLMVSWRSMFLPSLPRARRKR